MSLLECLIMYITSFSNRFRKKESSIKRLETLVSRSKDYDILSRLNAGDVLTVSVAGVMFRLCRYGSSLYAFRVKDNQMVHCEYSKTKNAMFIWNCWIPIRKLKRAGW